MQTHATKQIAKAKPYTFTQYLQKVNKYKPMPTSLSKATSDIIESNALSNEHIDSVVFTDKQGQEQKCTATLNLHIPKNFVTSSFSSNPSERYT